MSNIFIITINVTIIIVAHLQASGAMAAAAAQQGPFPGQGAMGTPSHASPMLPGPTSNGDPAMAQPPGAMGVRPPMGILPPGSRSPAANPAMQPFVGGAPPLHTPQEQQQSILAKMQQCMSTSQKLQQALNTGERLCMVMQCFLDSLLLGSAVLHY